MSAQIFQFPTPEAVCRRVLGRAPITEVEHNLAERLAEELRTLQKIRAARRAKTTEDTKA